MDNIGYVVAGYLIAGLSLGFYVGRLLYRARRARLRVSSLRRARQGGS